MDTEKQVQMKQLSAIADILAINHDLTTSFGADNARRLMAEVLNDLMCGVVDNKKVSTGSYHDSQCIILSRLTTIITY